jgi:hypothetical protein
MHLTTKVTRRRPRTTAIRIHPIRHSGSAACSSKPLRGGHYPSVFSSLSPLLPSRVTRSTVQPDGGRLSAFPHGWRGSPKFPVGLSGHDYEAVALISLPVRFHSPLALKLQVDLQLAGLGEWTQESYLRSVRKFAQWPKRAPDQACGTDPRRHLLFIKNDSKQ